jgi:hypothetical protein
MENNHECVICGNGYYACNKCDKINSWRRYVDTPSCYQLFLIIEEYMHEVISKAEARKLLANIGITFKTLKKEDYKESVYNVLADITNSKIAQQVKKTK